MGVSVFASAMLEIQKRSLGGSGSGSSNQENIDWSWRFIYTTAELLISLDNLKTIGLSAIVFIIAQTLSLILYCMYFPFLVITFRSFSF